MRAIKYRPPLKVTLIHSHECEVEVKMESTSNIGISEAQQRVEQKPSDLIAPPTATGTYQVDDSVIECE